MLTSLNFSIIEVLIIILVVAMIGIAKGGLGGALAMLGVPILSFFMPSLQAAAILLPILIIMDIIGVWIWRGQWDKGIIRKLLPAALLGLAFAWGFASFISTAGLRLILGLMSVGFVLKEYWPGQSINKGPQRFTYFWGILSGFTSFIAHAGGPPFQILMVPLRLAPATFTATSVLFFATLNAIKLVPYTYLGQFNGENILLSLTMFPIAILFTWFGARMVNHIEQKIYYPIINTAMFIVGAYLIIESFGKLVF